MNPRPASEHSPRQFWSYCLVYVAWFIAIAVSGYLFLLCYAIFTQWYITLGLRHSAYRASSQFFSIVGGIVWLVFIFFSDDYLKTGVDKGVLRHRLVVIYAALLVCVLLAGALKLITLPLLGVT